MSALIATASLIVRCDNFDISSVDLNLPEVVKPVLKKFLPPFINAFQVDGYQEKKKRKAFIVGNTGMYINLSKVGIIYDQSIAFGSRDKLKNVNVGNIF